MNLSLSRCLLCLTTLTFAAAAGFEEVVASHAVAPLIGLVGRGDSTVADAYLSPVLLRNVHAFRDELAAQGIELLDGRDGTSWKVK